MNFVLALPQGMQPQLLINRCGYATHRDRFATEQSFVRLVSSYPFPRFHLYLQKLDDKGMHCSLHLDQKQPTYLQGHTHSGDYDGPAVEKEVARIQAASGAQKRGS